MGGSGGVLWCPGTAFCAGRKVCIFSAASLPLRLTACEVLLQDEERVDAIIGKLVDVLNTPSESVQRKVSECLVPLMRSKKVPLKLARMTLQTCAEQGMSYVVAYVCLGLQDSAQALVQRLLHTLTDSDSYGERRGAAFGLAGVVKGLGLRALKQHNILEALKRGMENKWVHGTALGWFGEFALF